MNLGLRGWFDSKNPYAYQEMTAIMLETARKGYWKPSAEVLKRLANEYAQSVSKHGPAGASRLNDNTAFDKYLSDQLNAPGNLTGIQLSSSYKKAMERSSGATSQALVAGQRLVKQLVSAETQTIVRYSALTIFSLLGFAALFHYGLRNRTRS